MVSKRIVTSTCPYCVFHCGVLAHVTKGRVIRIEGDPCNPVNRGVLCVKALASLEYLYHPDRLKHPLKRIGEKGEGKWQQLSWDEALGSIASELIKVRDDYGAESVAIISGAYGGLRDNYLKRFSNTFGTPNFTWMGHVCSGPRAEASMITHGFEPIPDYEYPPACIVTWGANVRETRIPEYERTIQTLNRGTKLMVIDPRGTDLADRANICIKPRPGSDLALALAMINVIVNESLFDKAFVDNWTIGFGKLKVHVQDYSPERVEAITWVPSTTIREASRFYARNKPACIQWGNGLENNINSFQVCRAISILRAITGNLAIPGGESRWLLPTLPGPPELTLENKLPVDMLGKKVDARYKLIPTIRPVLPQSIIEAIMNGNPYPIHVAYIQGSNPLLSYNNTQETYRALKKLDFLGVAEIFMTPTAALADIVLPAATYLEFDSIVNTPTLASIQVQQRVTRIGECWSDYEILYGLAKRLGLGEYFWDSEKKCLDAVLKPVGVTFEEFRKIKVISGRMEYRGYQTNGFKTASGKVEIYSSQLKDWGLDPLPIYYEPPETPWSAPELAEKYPLVLTSYKATPFRHSGGKQITTLRGSHPEPITGIHPETANKLGIKEGEWVYIETKRGRIKQKAILISNIDPRVVIVDYGWWFPERGVSEFYGWAESNINVLTDNKPPYNREVGSTTLRGMLCKVYKVSWHKYPC
ncbi:molybdopterin-dependent oxidoreductase [Chloroflexota bacterium]